MKLLKDSGNEVPRVSSSIMLKLWIIGRELFSSAVCVCMKFAFYTHIFCMPKYATSDCMLTDVQQPS